MRSTTAFKGMPSVLAGILGILIIASLVYLQGRAPAPDAPQAAISATPSPEPTLSPAPVASPDAVTPSPGPSDLPSPTAPGVVDLTTDPTGLSKSTVVLTTNKGVIKFKLYPQDAPHTVNRIVELIQQGFYNGLGFHRVVPGFVVQGGDPRGDGTGGSGQKLKAEFNNRRHIEGTVAMARGMDPDSADSQFYISLGTHPHLDRAYTVFGQVIEGMDIARKIEKGDKIVSIALQ